MWQISKSGRIDRLVVFRFESGSYRPVGELTFEGSGRIRHGRFVYAKNYLAFAKRKSIDPIGLPLSRKSKSAAPYEVNLVFYDSGPDGWGKNILEQAFPTLSLSMPEFLALGGLRRTGNLAFGPTQEGPETWEPDTAALMKIPTDDDLELLLSSAAAVEEGNANADHFARLWHSSADVGGARPKARILYKGIDWIAKLPTSRDKFDEPRIEAVCLDVAAAAGINVPEHEIIDIKNRSILLVRRFDRSAHGDPYSYISAATLLKASPNEYATKMTYVDIASVAKSIGVQNSTQDMFRRLILNSYLHNTDDHLRNHAMIDDGEGWKLCPAFDIVPQPDVKRHVCAPAPGISPEWSPEFAFNAHSHFGIALEEASQIKQDVIDAVCRISDFMDIQNVSDKDRKIIYACLPNIEI